ncbi:hypothetical protein HOI26_03035 [Candidatus Woesearchaeota archaeon]|nr:hypothetical protein [Candidatus Woesearchaeota archaeon]MBT5740053.1 hypothetical protein [Candidatus Woesearchaeota archaeon]
MALQKNSNHRALWSHLQIWLGIVIVLVGLLVFKYSWIASVIVLVIGILLLAWKKKELKDFKEKQKEK